MTGEQRKMLRKAAACTRRMDAGREASIERTRLWTALRDSGMATTEIARECGEKRITVQQAISRQNKNPKYA